MKNAAESVDHSDSVKASGHAETTRMQTRIIFTSVLTFWGLGVLMAGHFGVFTRVPLLVFGPLVLTGIVAPILAYYWSALLRDFIGSVDPVSLTIFHIWRIPAGLTFLYYGSRHLLPHRFVLNAGYGDIAVGLLVPVILLLRGGVRKYIVFDVLSLLDFVVAVGTGITFTLLQVPSMENIRAFPVVLIPLYGVCVTGALSVMALDSILRKQRASLPSVG